MTVHLSFSLLRDDVGFEVVEVHAVVHHGFVLFFAQVSAKAKHGVTEVGLATSMVYASLNIINA